MHLPELRLWHGIQGENMRQGITTPRAPIEWARVEARLIREGAEHGLACAEWVRKHIYFDSEADTAEAVETATLTLNAIFFEGLQGLVAAFLRDQAGGQERPN